MYCNELNVFAYNFKLTLSDKLFLFIRLINYVGIKRIYGKLETY